MQSGHRIVGRHRNGRGLPGLLGEQFQAVIDSVASYCREILDVDVSDRLPAAQTVGLFDVQRFEEFAKVNGRHDPDISAFVSVNGSLYLRKDERAVVLKTLAHELGHSVAPRALNIVPSDDGNPSVNGGRVGYETSHRLGPDRTDNRITGSVLEEVLTEAMAMDVIATQWSNDNHLSQFARRMSVGYQHEMVVADELFARVSAVMNVDAVEYLRSLQRGRLTGDMKALRPTLEILGQQRSVALFEWGYATTDKNDPLCVGLDMRDRNLNTSPLVKAQRIAKRLDLGSGVEERLQRLEAGRRVPVMNYLTPNAVAVIKSTDIGLTS